MSAYVFDGRRCSVCLFRRNEYRHLKQCVPQRFWPPAEDWLDNQPVIVKPPQKVGKYPYEVYAQAFSTVLSQPVREPVTAYRAPEGVDNQTVYLDEDDALYVSVGQPEPWPSPAEVWGERLARVTMPTEEATATAYLEARNDRGLPSEGTVRINPYPEIVIGPYERESFAQWASEPATGAVHGASTQAHIANDGTATVVSNVSGLVCDVCGKVCKHLGALTGHKRSHKGGA